MSLNEQAAIATGWFREYIHGNGVDREVWVSPEGLCYDELPDGLKQPSVLFLKEPPLC